MTKAEWESLQQKTAVFDQIGTGIPPGFREALQPRPPVAMVIASDPQQKTSSELFPTNASNFHLTRTNGLPFYSVRP